MKRWKNIVGCFGFLCVENQIWRLICWLGRYKCYTVSLLYVISIINVVTEAATIHSTHHHKVNGRRFLVAAISYGFMLYATENGGRFGAEAITMVQEMGTERCRSPHKYMDARRPTNIYYVMQYIWLPFLHMTKMCGLCRVVDAGCRLICLVFKRMYTNNSPFRYIFYFVFRERFLYE